MDHGEGIHIVWTGAYHLVGLRSYVGKAAGRDEGLGAGAMVLQVICTFFNGGRRGIYAAMVCIM